MEIAIAVLSSIIGSAGIFGFIQFLISRHDTKDRDLAQIKQQLTRIEKKSDRNEMAIARLQLLFLLESQPDNEEAIETTAQRYFVELGGNAEAWAPFCRWADTHKVNLSWYEALLDKERRNNGKRN